jgi:hypothetical protein
MPRSIKQRLIFAGALRWRAKSISLAAQFSIDEFTLAGRSMPAD